MSWHDRVEELASAHRLDAPVRARLLRLAGLGVQPVGLPRRLASGVAALAALLLGLGLMFWIAANLESLGRLGRFALLQGALLLVGLAALVWPRPRAALGLLLLLGCGGLLAYFGQTYQTGADPWQLFALWALLTLPLCLGLRTDLLWLPWGVVATAAVALWVQAHGGFRGGGTAAAGVQMLGWGAALLLTVGLSPLARALSGAGTWALRSAVLWVTLLILFSALGTLFSVDARLPFALGLLVLLALAGVFASRRGFDLFALSALTLAIDTLLVAGLARWLFQGPGVDAVGSLLLLGAVAAGLLAVSVSAVMRLARRAGQVGHVDQADPSEGP